MHLSAPVAHAICLALVIADLVARTYRLQWLTIGVGSRLTFSESLRINAFADAGSTLTPMRVGGEPARLAGMLACGVPATASFVAIAYEVITAWPVLIAVGPLGLPRLCARVVGERRAAAQCVAPQGVALGPGDRGGQPRRLARRAARGTCASTAAEAPAQPHPRLLATDAALATPCEPAALIRERRHPHRHPARPGTHAAGSARDARAHRRLVRADLRATDPAHAGWRGRGGVRVPRRSGGKSWQRWIAAAAGMAHLCQRDRHGARHLAGHPALRLAGGQGRGGEDLRRVAPAEDQPGGGAIDTSSTVRSSASSTPCGTPAGAHTSVPASATSVSSPTVILAFPESTK